MIRVNGIPAVPGIPPGCSAPNGHYIGLAVVQTAIGFGMADTMAEAAAETYEDHYFDDDWPHRDHWDDYVVEAEAWLEQHTTGGVWHRLGGDFRLDATTACEECGEPRYLDPDLHAGMEDCGEGHLWSDSE